MGWGSSRGGGTDAALQRLQLGFVSVQVRSGERCWLDVVLRTVPTYEEALSLFHRS